ncbi:MAG: chorismate lyase [Candidatus Hydrothermarchaeota archaeon]
MEHFEDGSNNVNLFESLKKVERDLGRKLTPVERIILTTDGSITTILESLSGEKVNVRTVLQRVIKSDKEISNSLSIREGSDVNERIVILESKYPLVYAKSYTPLSILEPWFMDNIMKEDIPIGRIIRKLKMEIRRDLERIFMTNANRNISKLLETQENERLISRSYLIFYKKKKLLHITEVFSPKINSF